MIDDNDIDMMTMEDLLPPKKHKGARKLTNRVMVKVSDMHNKNLRAFCKKHGYTISGFMRLASLQTMYHMEGRLSYDKIMERT